MLLEFGEQFPSFSIVSHSQGGLASLHLHAFYWSKLETASGGRLLQSVGSPYRGTALAGSLAGIGDVFGVGCGTHSEMTHDGAALWFTSIPKDLTSYVLYSLMLFDAASCSAHSVILTYLSRFVRLLQSRHLLHISVLH